MNIMVLQVFVSLMLVLGSIVLLAISIKQDDHEHADRLSLLPFEPERETEANETEESDTGHRTGRRHERG